MTSAQRQAAERIARSTAEQNLGKALDVKL